MAKRTTSGNGSLSPPEHPSSNWNALRKKLSQRVEHKAEMKDEPQRKRRKLDHQHSPASAPSNIAKSTFEVTPSFTEDTMDGESRSSLRRMIQGKLDSADNTPGKYLALDCEMVGVGVDGSESSLARVSIINFHGVVLMDEFVRQRERVVDYRTRYSGVRPSDLAKARSFDVIQKDVADLLKEKILVGHAIHNDLKALLLSHPQAMTRDTQYLAGKSKVVKSRRVALRDLVKQELGVTIQSGEHSSVTDARATMAVYRLHRKKWEKMQNAPAVTKRKRKSDTNKVTSIAGVTSEFPGGGRSGVSSGLTTVVRRAQKKGKWWKQLLGNNQTTAGS